MAVVATDKRFRKRYLAGLAIASLISLIVIAENATLKDRTLTFWNTVAALFFVILCIVPLIVRYFGVRKNWGQRRLQEYVPVGSCGDGGYGWDNCCEPFLRSGPRYRNPSVCSRKKDSFREGWAGLYPCCRPFMA